MIGRFKSEKTLWKGIENIEKNENIKDFKITSIHMTNNKLSCVEITTKWVK